MHSFLVLLRGINVGGNNIIRMAELRELLETAGFRNVETYIQSGNILLDSNTSDREFIRQGVSKVLKSRLGTDIMMVILQKSGLERIIAEAPSGFGSQSETYRSDVFFYEDEVSGAEEIRAKCMRDEVDEMWQGSRAIYFRRLSNRATQSKLSKITGLPVYQRITIRNWNTTTKLLELWNNRDPATPHS